MTMVFVIYPGDAGMQFDRDYYVTTHMPLVRQAWGPYGLASAEAFFPVGEVPGSGSTGTIAVCLCVFRDDAAITASLNAPETARVMDDVKHFTNAQPSQLRAIRL